MTGTPNTIDAGHALEGKPLSAIRRLRLGISSAVAAVLGVAPHVLHHAGPLAGAALLGGVGGSLIFGAVGFVLAVPLLLRLHRRFSTWRVPAAALALFAVVFSISTFFIGPAINGSGDGSSKSVVPGQSQPQPSGHDAHHE